MTYPLFKTRLTSEIIDLSQTLGGVQINLDHRIISASAWLLMYQLQQDHERERSLGASVFLFFRL